MYIFLYDTLMSKRMLSKLIDLDNIISIRPAFMRDVMLTDAERQKSFYSNRKLKTRFPIMIDKRDVYRISRNPKIVYGACIELEDDMTLFKSFDGYYSCSKFGLGDNKQADMFHRRSGRISVIKFDSKEEFLKHNFEVTEEVIGYAYLGNVQHDMLKLKFERNKNTNRTVGVVWKTFFNVF